MQINSNVAVQGRFSGFTKNDNLKKKAEEKNNPAQSATDRYLDRIESLEEQIKKVQKNEKLDEKSKKEKIKELTKQIEEVKLREEERKLNELKYGTEEDGKVNKGDKAKEEEKANKDKGFKDTEDERYSENLDGDVLTLSEDVKELLKNADNLKKYEEKNDAKNKLKREERVLEREIDVDRGRAANPKRKEDKLLALRDRIDDIDNNKIEKATSVDENKNISLPYAKVEDADSLNTRIEQEKFDVENKFKLPKEELEHVAE